MFPHETRILLFTMSCTQSTNKQHTGLWLELVFYKNPHHHNTAWLRGEKKSAVTSFEREAAILKKVHGFLQSFTNVVLFSVASLITFQCVFVFCPYDLATQTSSFRSSWIVLTYLQRLMWEWLLPWRHLWWTDRWPFGYIWRLIKGANPSTSWRSTSALCKGGSTSITTFRFRRGSRLDSVTLWQWFTFRDWSFGQYSATVLMDWFLTLRQPVRSRCSRPLQFLATSSTESSVTLALTATDRDVNFKHFLAR